MGLILSTSSPAMTSRAEVAEVPDPFATLVAVAADGVCPRSLVVQVHEALDHDRSRWADHLYQHRVSVLVMPSTSFKDREQVSTM